MKGLVQLADHLVRVGNEVRREVPAVELHALDELDGGLEALALLDRDDAVFPDPLERVGHDLADLAVVVGGDGRDVDDVVGLGDVHGLGQRGELIGDGLGGRVHAALQRHRVGAGRQVLVGLLEQGLGQHGGGGRPIAGDLGSLARCLLYELCPEVLRLVFQFDLVGDGNAVLGHGRAAPALIDDGIAAARAERRFDCRRQLLHPG